MDLFKKSLYLSLVNMGKSMVLWLWNKVDRIINENQPAIGSHGNDDLKDLMKNAPAFLQKHGQSKFAEEVEVKESFIKLASTLKGECSRNGNRPTMDSAERPRYPRSLTRPLPAAGLDP